MTARTPMINGGTDSAETFRLALCGLFVPVTALNPRTGVTTTPVLTGTGNLTATIGAFTAMIDGTSGALQGGYPVANDAALTVTVTAGNTQPRIDLICLQIQDNDYDSSGFHRGIPLVVAGTPSGSPVAPSTPANAIPLWTIPVAANATSVTWASATAVYSYTAAAGGIVPVRNAADKPSAPSAVQYRHRLDVAAGGNTPLEYSIDNGVTWNLTAITPGLQKIGTATVATSGVQSSLSVSVPSAIYSSIMGIWTARVDANTTNQVSVQFNGDTAANYSYHTVEMNGSTVGQFTAGGTNIIVGRPAASIDTANSFGSGDFIIANAGSTGVSKPVRAQAVKAFGTSNVGSYGGHWTGSAPISSVVLTAPASNTFSAGSTLTLYGIL